MLVGGSQSSAQDDQTIYTEYVPCQKDALKFISQFRQQQLKAIERNSRLRRFNVVIDELRSKDKIFVTGRGEGLDDALEMVEGLIDKVVCDSFEIVQPGIATYCENGKLQSLLRIVNNEEKCYVRVKKKFLHMPSASSTTNTSAVRSAGSPPTNSTAGAFASVVNSRVKSADSFVLVTPQGPQVSWKVGDIATEQAHALVSSQGVCSKAIFAAAGPNIGKTFQAPLPGEITVTPGYQLACSHVIHTCCCEWNGGNGEAILRSIVRKSILKVNELGGDSIAFPIIGTGKLSFPPHEACRIMLDEAVTVCKNNPQSSVKDVGFVLFRGNQGVIDAFKQEGSNLQKKYCKNVEVVQGDLTKEKTDAIVNIIHTDMNINGAGELCKAVAKASGPQVENECRNLGQQSAGSAVMTSGGNMAVPNIIHMVVGSSGKQHLQLCVEKCVQLADAKGLKTISLPAVGTGAGGLPDVDSAQLIFQALRNSLESCVNLRHVRIVLYQANFMQAFLDEKKLMEKQNNKQPASSSTHEPPRKKIKTEQDGQPDWRNRDKVVIHVAGPSKAGVNRAVDTLKQGITDAFTSQKIEHQSVSQLSKKQVSDLEKYAKSRDVKFEIHSAVNNIVVHGEHSGVAKMVGKIWCRLNESLDQNRIADCAQQPKMSLPKNWEPMPRNQAGYDVTVHMIKLLPTCKEYQDIAIKFHQTASNLMISSIERIQNPHLYHAYQLRKEKMDKDNGGNNERQLFHGTSPDSVAKINTQGFNRSFSGTAHGTALGKGVYFARDAAYSAVYSSRFQAPVGHRCMYLSRVLVGQCCQGNDAESLVPPPKDPSRPEVLFDSVVNDAVNPSIFAVFFDNQCYPEYLIKF